MIHLFFLVINRIFNTQYKLKHMDKQKIKCIKILEGGRKKDIRKPTHGWESKWIL